MLLKHFRALLSFSSLSCCRSNFVQQIHSFRRLSSGNVDEIGFNREFEELKLEKFSELIKNEDDELRIRNVIDLYEYNKYMDGLVPSNISANEMQYLMSLSNHRCTRYFHYLLTKEKTKLALKIKKEERRKLVAEKRAAVGYGKDTITGIFYKNETGAPVYGLWHNSLFLNIGKTEATINGTRPQLLSALQFSPPLVFDFDFETAMNLREMKKLAVDVHVSMGLNRHFDYPFNVWFCNYRPDAELDTCFKSMKSSVLNPLNFVNFTKKSYLDLFPKKNIIYLTADAPRKMTTFDHNAIYILGAVNEIGQKKKLTVAKAKSERVTMMRLPLDDYVVLKKSRDLSLEEMLKILHEHKLNGNWSASLKHIHSEKLFDEKELLELNAIKKTKSLFQGKQLHQRVMNKHRSILSPDEDI